MPVSRIVVARHATRQDTVNNLWLKTSPCPYDPPLADPKGFHEAAAAGKSIANKLKGSGSERFIIHCSPFLRCVQTASFVAEQLDRTASVKLRLDGVFGEWQTPDYFTHISPPPSDGHRSIAESSTGWFLTHGLKRGTSPLLDRSWPLDQFGRNGEYGETWASMHSRIEGGLKRLIKYYDQIDDEKLTVIIVTHGAGCNSLLGFLSNQPLLAKIGLASFAMAERRMAMRWEITYNSNESDSDTLKIPVLSSSNSTSCSSMSDFYQQSQSEYEEPSFDLFHVPQESSGTFALSSFDSSYGNVSFGDTSFGDIIFPSQLAGPPSPDPTEAPLTLSFGNDFGTSSSNKPPSVAPSRSTTPTMP
jgi:broad specificity phosphatase PhoE